MIKTVIVFGGNGYIGTTIVEALTKEGYACIVIDQHGSEQGVASRTILLDMRDYTALTTKLRSLLEQTEKVDAVIFASGISAPGNFITQDFSQFIDVHQVNFLSVAYATKEILPYFIKKNGGKFIYIASLFAHVVAPEMAAYNSSKAALVQFAKSITEDYATHAIIANVISPGFIASPMVTEVLKTVGNNPKWMNLLYGLARKTVDINTVVQTTQFLLAQDNSINGANIMIDGGYSIR